MPRGQAFDLETFKTVSAKTVKKAAEETLAVWSPETGKRFRICGFTVFFSKAGIITLEDESTVFFITSVAENVGQSVTLPQGGYLSVKAGNKLNFKTSVEGALSGTFYGVEDIA
jgi:hypothetical protein